MRRPLPPDLVVLGDHLEAAVRRTVGHRRTRRQAVLNALTGLLVALPLVPAVLGAMTPPVPEPPAPAKQTRAVSAAAGDDFPPRVLRGAPTGSGRVLAEPTTLRRALR